MPARDKSSRQIVPAPAQALVLRSSALVTRGLRDLSRESNWLVKKVFTGRSPHLAVSPEGQICAVSPLVRRGLESVALYDIEIGVPLLALAVPGSHGTSAPGQPAAFAWSPSGRLLVAAWSGWPRSLHAFDLSAKLFLGAFGTFDSFPSAMAWSESGNYFVAASSGGGNARVQLWQASEQLPAAMPFEAAPVAELPLAECSGWPEWRESASPDGDAASAAGELVDDVAVEGFGHASFSPDEGSLACVVQIGGDWADDSIAILEVPSLRKQTVFHAQGNITDLSWTYDGRQIFFCSAGQASRLAADTM
ncbi:MAG: WD40 repeat domain-containing protein, partial [Acidobacteriota bacterium]|nr:WD40 repeat domain-containing protein [Acidobacteriota bacterium]